MTAATKHDKRRLWLLERPQDCAARRVLESLVEGHAVLFRSCISAQAYSRATPSAVTDDLGLQLGVGSIIDTRLGRQRWLAVATMMSFTIIVVSQRADQPISKVPTTA